MDKPKFDQAIYSQANSDLEKYLVQDLARLEHPSFVYGTLACIAMYTPTTIDFLGTAVAAKRIARSFARADQPDAPEADSAPCAADLTKSDTYENLVVPDADLEIALKVLRTARDACVDAENFDAEGAVLLSTAHAKLHEMARDIIALETQVAP